MNKSESLGENMPEWKHSKDNETGKDLVFFKN